MRFGCRCYLYVVVICIANYVSFKYNLGVMKVYSVYISPTGNTAKVTTYIAETIASLLGVAHLAIDFTLPKNRTGALVGSVPLCFNSSDIVVFGTPTYAGRVPNKFLPIIEESFKARSAEPFHACGEDALHTRIEECFNARGAMAVPIVTFGNRNYDSSLLELKEVLKKNGFFPIGAAAICCKHAFAEIGIGMPSEEDFEKMKTFAEKLANIIEEETQPGVDFGSAGASTSSGAAEEDVFAAKEEVLSTLDKVLGAAQDIQPYYTPLKEDGSPASFLKAKPVTDMSKCTKCNICAEHCPMGSITFYSPQDVPGICIKCQACITYCPEGAKSFQDPDFISHKKMLVQNYVNPGTSIFLTL